MSEELIAEALHPYPDGLVIATKGGLRAPGPGEWRPDGRPEHLRAACEGSLRRLRLERIDLYQLHAPDPKVPLRGVGRRARRSCRTRARSATSASRTSIVEQLAAARAIVDVVSVQNRYNLTDRDSEDVLDACEADGIGFIPWFPLGAGKLARPGGALDEIAAAHDADAGPDRARVAARALAGDAPDPRHLVRRAPRGERGGGGDRAVRGRAGHAF